MKIIRVESRDSRRKEDKDQLPSITTMPRIPTKRLFLARFVPHCLPPARMSIGISQRLLADEAKRPMKKNKIGDQAADANHGQPYLDPTHGRCLLL
jgi:hypothetical protein